MGAGAEEPYGAICETLRWDYQVNVHFLMVTHTLSHLVFIRILWSQF